MPGGGLRFASVGVLTTVLFLGAGPAAWAGPSAAAVREAAEYLLERFGGELSEETVERLVPRLDSLAARYGDDALAAVRKGGPRALAAVENAGEAAPAVVKLLAERGDDALWLVEDAARLRLATAYGDDGATALVRHKGIAEPLLTQFEAPAARALAALDGQNARRLAAMAADGELARLGRTPELLDVMARYGDRAMDFVWRNKAALATGAVLAAFLADPQPFLDGTRELASVAVSDLARPVAETVSRELATRTEWTTVWLAAMAVIGVYAGSRLWLARRAAT